jgi:hypothetical protein
MTAIGKIIKDEETKLANTTGEFAVNILYNLIFLKQKNDLPFYQEVKKLFDHFVISVKTERFGYDSINYQKLNNAIELLSIYEQISAVNYCLSIVSKELPEHDRSWFLSKKQDLLIKEIFTGNRLTQFPKGVLLICGRSLISVVISLIVVYSLTSILLLPATSTKFALFSVQYQDYSSSFLVNHFLNILSLMCDLDSGMKVTPINAIGLIVIVLGKLSFVLIVLNYLIIKISEQIELK